MIEEKPIFNSDRVMVGSLSVFTLRMLIDGIRSFATSWRDEFLSGEEDRAYTVIRSETVDTECRHVLALIDQHKALLGEDFAALHQKELESITDILDGVLYPNGELDATE